MDGAAYADRIRTCTTSSLANAAAAVIAAGPAVVAGLAGLRGRLLWLPLAAIAGMAVSDASGLVLGETERIWLPFLRLAAAGDRVAAAPERSGSGWRCPRCSRSPSRSSSAAPGDQGAARRGSVANARMPSSNVDARPEAEFLLGPQPGLATTCRTSPIRYSPVTSGSGPPNAPASARAMSPTVCGRPEATL